MADIELVIKIPAEAKKAFDCAESNDLKGCYYDHGGIIGNAIKNGTPLPKHHGDLGDLNAVYDDFRQHYFDNPTVMRCAEIVLGNAPTIIPATKGESNADSD